jgi:hypothetical protein
VNLRHAVALGLVGWYLMMPPMEPPYGPKDSDPFPWQSHAPLPLWQIHEVFDTAAECKAAEEKLEDHGIHLWNYAAIVKHHVDKKIAEQSVREQNAICIATDDPRLKD